jgi:hypothetical protein
MTDYEQMIVSAERYALGRMTYIVEITVNYILQEIENDKLSDSCLAVILQDLKDCTYFGNHCDEREWKRLKDRIEEVI